MANNKFIRSCFASLCFLFGLAAFPTEVHAAESYTVTYDANDQGKFSNGQSQNVVVYADKQIERRISKTDNVSDDGLTSSGDYSPSQKTDVITIEGATSLKVTVTYETYHAGTDYVALFDSNMTVSPGNATSSVSGKLGGTKNTQEFTVEGDTVTIFFFTVSPYKNYYGYYAVVEGETTGSTISGTYEEPTKTASDFVGWYTDAVCTEGNEFDISTLNSDITVYAKYESWPILRSGSISNVIWRLYENGLLQISPRDGISGSLPNMGTSYPWLSQSASVKSIIVDGTVTATSCANMFQYMENCTSMDLRGLDVSNATEFTAMFLGCQNLTSLDISTFNTSKATVMKSMFNTCSRLTNLNLSHFNTANVTDMAHMFANCGQLSTLNISSFNTSNVEDMEGLFMSCGRLTSLSLRHFNTSKVKDMGTMFHYCNNLRSLDISSFDTKNCEGMYGMFYMCTQLTTLNLGHFNTSNVTRFDSMFYGCSNLTTLDLSNFDTSNADRMDRMFYSCSKLETLDLRSFDTQTVTKMDNMFSYASALTRITLGTKFAFVGTAHAFNDATLGTSWIKTYSTTGVAVTDPNIYSASEIASFTNTTTPKLEGTWAKAYTYNISYKTASNITLGTDSITKGFGTANRVSAAEFPGYTTPSDQMVVWSTPSSRTIMFTYTPIEYTVTLDLNGGSGVDNRTYNIETATFTLGTPTKSKNTFVGWTGANGSVPETTVTIAKGSVGNVAYTANWQMDDYAIITYNAGSDGLFSADRTENVVVYEDAHTISSGAYEKPEPIDKSMVFAGWYTDIDCTDGNEFTIPAANTEITVYAKYMLVTDVDYTLGTKVTYNNPNVSEAYVVTVPARLTPTASGSVVASGTWASNRQLNVIADDTVTLINSINSAETRTLDIHFDGIFKTGSNVQSISATKDISVAPIANTIFGVWTGTFNYIVEMADIV